MVDGWGTHKVRSQELEATKVNLSDCCVCCPTLLTSHLGLSRELSSVVDVAAVASVVLALAVIVDMVLAVATVLAMAMEATKVCLLFDCCVSFSTFLTPLSPPYPTPMHQQRNLWAGALRLQHGPVGASSAL